MSGISISIDIGVGSGGFASGSFTPGSLAGLVADYDLTDESGLTLVSGNIQAVRNGVSSSMACAAPVAGARPVFTDPGGGAAKYAQFSAAAPSGLVTTETAVVNAFRDASPLTVVALAKSDTVVGAACIVGGGAGAARPYRLCIRNATKFAYETINNSGGVDQLKETALGIADTSTHVLAWRDSGASIRLSVDGVSKIAATPYTAPAPVTITSVGLGSFLFTGGTLSTSAFTGRIYRVCIYSRELSNSELATLTTFIGSIAGLSL